MRWIGIEVEVESGRARKVAVAARLKDICVAPKVSTLALARGLAKGQGRAGSLFPSIFS